MSIQLLPIALSSPGSPHSASFSSDPDSGYNKGAIEFLQLVEEALRKQEQLNFSDLLIQMRDLHVGERVPTPDDIAGSLNKQGWAGM